MESIKSMLLLSFLIITNLTIHAQEGCAAPKNCPNLTYYEQTSLDPLAVDPICVNVFFHIVRETNGNGGYNSTNFDNVIQNLNNVFNPHNIIIKNAGYDYINNSTLASMIATSANVNTITQTQKKTTALNIYIMPNALFDENGNVIAGAANYIPGDGLIIDKNFLLQSTLAHEIGHCFNVISYT